MLFNNRHWGRDGVLKLRSADGRTSRRSYALGSPVVRALDLRLDGREFNSRPPWLVLGWVIVFGRANHLSISPYHPGQLSLLPSAGREISTGQSAVTLCGWGVKAGMAYLFHLWMNVWVAGKTV